MTHAAAGPGGAELTPPIVQLFVNPKAGGASRGRLRALTAAFEGAGARVILAHDQGSDPRIAQDATHVVAFGGDGTLRHVAAAAGRAGRPLRLAIYPAGTVNLIARECGYARDPAAFARRVLRDAPPRLHHHALIGETPLFGCASVGPDARAVAALSPRLKRRIGRAAYAVAFLTVLIRWRRPRLRLVHDGGELACEAAYVAKGRFFAGPWSFAPEAALDQPLLHVFALARATRRDYLRFLWRLWRGQDSAGLPGAIRFACTDLTLTGDDDTPLQADGDIVGTLPARLRLCPDQLAFA